MNTEPHGECHDFTDYEPRLGGTPLMYCRRCGEVRRLELTVEHRVVVNMTDIDAAAIGKGLTAGGRRAL